MVLLGAKALASPVLPGQSIQIEERPVQNKPMLWWKAFSKEKLWFLAGINLSDFSIATTNNKDVAEFLVLILKEAQKINPAFLPPDFIYEAKTQLEFDRNWGLGSSSTLISLISQWAEVDPYNLFFNTSTGSGYDVACARAKNPLIYYLADKKVPVSESVNLHQQIKKSLYFIYLGKKSNSPQSVKHFLESVIPKEKDMRRIGEISQSFTTVQSVEKIKELITEHERILASVLHRDPVKQKFFPDFKGEIKSLGAWGGDFIMASWNKSEEELKKYFISKKLKVIFNYKELIRDE